MEILLIVGSEMGNAEMVAECVQDVLTGDGYEVHLFVDGAPEEARVAEHGLILVCTSTTGVGDIPQNIEPLYQSLSETRPDLSKARYGMIGLGDRNYAESFCGGPKKWDALLSELGATKVGDSLLMDANENLTPDEDAVAWLPSWLEQVEAPA